MRVVWLLIMALAALPAGAAEVKASALFYRVSEVGIDPYLTRWLVTARYLRIDEGDAADNYILFDRKERQVHSVVHGDRTVLDIPFRPVAKKPAIEIDNESRVVRDEGLPAIGGQPPLHRELRVNNTLCYSVISVEQLLPDTVAALRDYRSVMAGEHAKNIDNTPVELQQPCDLALHIFTPLWLLEGGLPIQQWDPEGNGQALLDYQAESSVDSALFTLPPEYRHYQTQGTQ